VTREHLTILCQRFVAAVQAHTRALEEMDEAGAQRRVAMLLRLQQSIMSTPGGRAEMLALLQDHRPEVRGVAALNLLSLHPGPALEVLRQLALLPGLMGFRASVALERWEKGELGGNDGP
jgi:aspartate carbamoyltransferase catalytic subunit